MENKDNFAERILSEWSCPKGDHIDMQDYIDRNADKCFIIDMFPYQIKDPEKNHQVEIFYRKFLDDDVSAAEFLNCETKYLDLIKNFWLYNQVEVCYDLQFAEYFRKGFLKRRSFRKTKRKYEIQENVTSWAELKELTVLALREAGYLILHFKTWNVIAVINDFCVLIICKEKDILDMIDPIVSRCGLYVRSVLLQ